MFARTRNFEWRNFGLVLFPFEGADFVRPFFFVDQVSLDNVFGFGLDFVVRLLLDDFLLNVLDFRLGGSLDVRENLLPSELAFFA